jgi:phosphoribosylglycinamide formyltransferase-1
VTRRRVAVLISGRGSNLAALIAACDDPGYPAEICLVVSNRPEAAGLQLARRAGIPAFSVDHKSAATRAEFEAELHDAIRGSAAELVCLAGFMRLLSAEFTGAWRDRLINIHPSLLPAFPGLHTHERAIDAGVRIHGATVHFVRAETDRGPIIAQAAVPVLPGDSAEALAARVLRAEHRLYPLALRLVASGAATVIDERVEIRGATFPSEAALLCPDG